MINDKDIEEEEHYWAAEILDATQNEDHIMLPVKSDVYQININGQPHPGDGSDGNDNSEIKLQFTSDIENAITEEQAKMLSEEPAGSELNTDVMVPGGEDDVDSADMGGGKSKKKHTRKKRRKHTRKKHNKKKKTKRKNKKKTKKRRS